MAPAPPCRPRHGQGPHVKRGQCGWLIQDGRYLISDICYMVGMSSPSYFSKLFFRQFGISPKDFEKQCRDSDQGGMA